MKGKFKLIAPDYIILAAFLLMISCHGMTQYMIAQHTSVIETNEDSIKLITALEQNPLAAWLLNFQKLRLLYSLVIVPTLFIGVYVFARIKYWETKEMLYLLSIMVLAMFMINFTNDFGYFLGFLI